jgi:hypothetical protein
LLTALETYSRTATIAMDDLAREAFGDLLRKHHQPAGLRDALKRSVRTLPANDQAGAQRKATP